MTAASPIPPIPAGLDDGYAMTKVALPDGHLFVIPSRARLGRAAVSWIHRARQRIFEYETEECRYSVGAVDGAPTAFEGYAWSGLNRVIVQHALQEAGLAGRSVHAISGLPVSSFYGRNGAQRHETIAKKRASLKQAVRPLASVLPAAIAFHEVIPEALAAWYDYVIIERDGKAHLDEDRLSLPIAVIDIGGRTTDFVVVKDQGINHAASGSLPCGMLDVQRQVADGIQERFDLERLSEHLVTDAVATHSVCLHGKAHDIGALVTAAKREVIERIYTETRRQLGLGIELDRVLFVGGGAVALHDAITNWFPQQAIAEHPAFANARGMLKYLRYVCEASDAA